MRKFTTVAALGAAVLFVACGGDGPTDPAPQQPGVRVMAGGSAWDTIDTQLAQALVVEVRTPSGHLAKGAIVRFEPVPVLVSRLGSRAYAPVYACRIAAPTCPGFYATDVLAIDTTGADGRAKVIVRFAGIVGRAVLRVTVPEYGFVDSATYTVTPGAPARVRLASHDTAAVVGASVTVGAVVVDRYDNPRAEDPVVTGPSGVDVAGRQLTGRAVGEYTLTARYAALTDTAHLRIVPPGRLVVWDEGSKEVRLVNTDGTAERAVLGGASSDWGVFPRFGANATLTFHRIETGGWSGGPTRVIGVDTLTGARTEIAAADAALTYVAYARSLPDGRLRFLGYTAADYTTDPETPPVWSVFEARPGEAPARLREVPEFTGWYGGADLSPDGTRLAYVATTDDGRLIGIRVLDVATGALALLDATGHTPRWSPTGDRVAFLTGISGYGTVNGHPAVINADGTGRRVVAPDVVYTPGLAWSPDGTWLVGRDATAAALRVVRASDGTGVRLRFPHTSGVGGDTYTRDVDYFQPDWR